MDHLGHTPLPDGSMCDKHYNTPCGVGGSEYNSSQITDANTSILTVFVCYMDGTVEQFVWQSHWPVCR